MAVFMYATHKAQYSRIDTEIKAGNYYELKSGDDLKRLLREY